VPMEEKEEEEECIKGACSKLPSFNNSENVY
jgi:hypothetical protein